MTKTEVAVVRAAMRIYKKICQVNGNFEWCVSNATKSQADLLRACHTHTHAKATKPKGKRK